MADAYAVKMADGWFVGLWRDEETAKLVAGKHPKGEVVPMDEAQSARSAIAPHQLPPLTDVMYHAVRGMEFTFSGQQQSVEGCLNDDCLDEIWDAINTALRVQSRTAAPAASEQEPHNGAWRWIADAVKVLRAAPRIDLTEWDAEVQALLSGVPCPQEDLGFDSPADRAARLTRTEAAPIKEWLVWCTEAKLWWAADRRGYRKDPREAGRYTLDEARSICRVRSVEDGPPEAIVHEADALRGPHASCGMNSRESKP